MKEQIDDKIKEKEMSPFNKAVKDYITSNIESFDDFKGQKRLPDEDFEDYRVRRKAEKILTKAYLKGRYISINGKPVDDQR